MLRRTFSTLLIATSFSLLSMSAHAADPSLHQVYQAAQAGNYREAQSMMDQVLKNHPNSAKAHFVEAELLAREGRISNAKSELATAERLEPGLSFAKPAAVEELRSLLTPSQNTNRFVAPTATPVSVSSFPWGVLFLASGLIALLIVIIRMMSQRTSNTVQGSNAQGFGASATPAAAYGSNGVTPMPPTGGGGMGAGIMGGLATGAALGVGMVAGEALMHRVLDGQHSNGSIAPTENTSWNNPQPQYDMGGNDFGISDSASWDDSSNGSGDDWS